MKVAEHILIAYNSQWHITSWACRKDQGNFLVLTILIDHYRYGLPQSLNDVIIT